MDLEKAAAEFRAAARRAGPRGAGRRYPAGLRRRGAEHFQGRRAEGRSVKAIARELGVRRQTLLAWAAEPAGDAGPAFVPVSVVAETHAKGIVLHAPGGLRVEGLDVPALVEVLRGLA